MTDMTVLTLVHDYVKAQLEDALPNVSDAQVIETINGLSNYDFLDTVSTVFAIAVEKHEAEADEVSLHESGILINN